ncbi:MAG: HAMP domain-containing protein, partial [Rivularia sp. (in: cyanobacteria)]
MSIRTKIALALAFLFTVIVGLVLVGSYYLNQLAGDSREIIKDNYRTLSYVREMSSSLHNISSAYVPEGDTLLVATDAPLRQALQRFRENFRQQATNLTEVSEQSLTEDLQDDFAAIEQLTHDTIGAADYFGRLLPLINAADQGLNSIYLLNEESILHKNEVAQATASNVITYMAVIGVVCTVVGLAFLIGFPGYVANPLRKLTASIQQIAQRNYDERLNFSSQDEFGTLATSFNTMAEQLSE